MNLLADWMLQMITWSLRNTLDSVNLWRPQATMLWSSWTHFILHIELCFCDFGTTLQVFWWTYLLFTVGDWPFLAASTHTWICLPQHVTSASTLSVIKACLKTYLYVVYDVVEKTLTSRGSWMPCVIVKKYNASMWRRRRQKIYKKSTNFQQKFLRFTYSNNAHTKILVAYFIISNKKNWSISGQWSNYSPSPYRKLIEEKLT